MCLACLELARRKASAFALPSGPDAGAAPPASSARPRFVAEPLEAAPRPPAKVARPRGEVEPR